MKPASKPQIALTRGQRFLTLAALLLAASAAEAGIVYQVNRTIGAGTLIGQIETNGTLGTLTTGDFVAWSLTLEAPDINNGAPSTITTSLNPFFVDGGSALSATPTDLLFDFSISSLLFAFTSSGDFWCLAGDGGGAGCFAQGEIIGYSDTTGGAAYVEARSGVLAFGTVASAVPLPASWTLAGVALGLLALQRRRAVETA